MLSVKTGYMTCRCRHDLSKQKDKASSQHDSPNTFNKPMITNWGTRMDQVPNHWNNQLIQKLNNNRMETVRISLVDFLWIQMVSTLYPIINNKFHRIKWIWLPIKFLKTLFNQMESVVLTQSHHPVKSLSQYWTKGSTHQPQAPLKA